MRAHNPRAVANLLLDEADQRGIRVTNLALQKLLYFAHGIHLTQTTQPLLTGYFEAWQYGPVHPSVYRAFKESGSSPIQMRAQGQDPLTGRKRDLVIPVELSVVDLVRQVLHSYGRMSPGRLVDSLDHDRPNAPVARQELNCAIMSRAKTMSCGWTSNSEQLNWTFLQASDTT